MKLAIPISIDRPMVLPKAYYLLYYGAAASLIPYLSIYYQSIGFSGKEIGLLVAIPPLVMLVGAPLWGGLADATRQHKRLLMLAIVLALLSVVALSLITRFVVFIPAVAAYALFVAPVMPLIDNTVMEMLGERRGKYGKQRLWGAVGWGIAAPLVGWRVEQSGLHWTFLSYIVLMSAGLLVIWFLPVKQTSIGSKFWRGLRSLLLNWQWVIFLLLVFIGGTILSIISNFLFLYLNDMSASKTLMGLSLTVATLSEMPVLFFSDQLLKRWDARGLLTFALLILVVRSLAYSLINSPGLVLLIQLLHGLSFSTMWVAGVSYANDIAPKGMGATAQGLFSGVQLGLAGTFGGLIGGFLYENLGAVMMFRWVGMIGFVALILFLMVEMVSNKLPHTFKVSR
jgi:MFS transporter, PPP family, 3-phenylpropionic acid transporter